MRFIFKTYFLNKASLRVGRVLTSMEKGIHAKCGFARAKSTSHAQNFLDFIETIERTNTNSMSAESSEMAFLEIRKAFHSQCDY